MVAFEIHVNGKHLATAGVGQNGVVSTILSWSIGPEPQVPHGQMTFGVGGADATDHLDWAMPSVGVGDEITIKLVNVEADAITEVRRFQPDAALQGQMQQVLGRVAPGNGAGGA